MFRINVDGIADNSVSDLVIRKRDSMYIFVEVTLDPNNIDSILRIHTL